MRRSFTLRLAVAFAGVGVSAAALTAILVNLSFGSRFSGYLEEQQRVREERLVATLADSYRRMGGWDAGDLESVIPPMLMDGGALRVEDASGREVWDAEQAPGAGMSRMHQEMMGTGPLGPERRLPVEVDDATVGFALVRLPEPGLLPQDVSFRSSINRLLVFGSLIAGMVALALGIVVARRATAPARELTSVAQALAGGDRSRRIGSTAADEFGEMARAFDRMAEAIDAEDRLRRGFAADVAHELRTPLAILRSQVEALQDGVAAATPESLASLHEETLRIARLVADLEALASADAAEFSLDRRPTSLASLVEGAVREFRGPFEGAGVRLEVDAVDLTVDADPVRVKQVLSNLLSNALKFTPAGGRVHVSLRPEGPWAAVRVSDTGPGIPADEMPRVFDRFFRGRSARSGGSGVGLTVVRELARAHGGDVDLASEPGRGAVFTLRLPLVGSPTAVLPGASSTAPAG